MKFTLTLFCAFVLASSAAYAATDTESGTGEATDAPETKTLIWPDGTRYVGGVKDGKRSGKGTIFWEDGTRFVGSFKDDLRHGPGTMILPDGTVYNGYFSNDKLVDTPAEADKPGVGMTTAAHTSDAPTVTTGQAGAGTLPETNIPGEIRSKDITEITDSVKADLISMIDLWAAAWSEQNVPQYLAYYSDNFEVPGRQSRRAWEGLRRSRLSRPGHIKLELTYERFEIIEPNVARVTFNQVYRSDVYSDETTKTLTLAREGLFWRILKEESS